MRHAFVVRAIRRMVLASVAVAALIASPAFADGDYTIFMAGQERGEMTVRTDRTGLRESRFRFVDRGRGPETTTRLRVDADGLPILLSVEGVSYYKTAVAETASRTGDVITWKSEADAGSGPAGTFYLANQADAEISAALARALIKAPGGELTLLPGGKARIEAADERILQSADGPVRTRLYFVTGLGYDAQPVWLACDGELLAEASSWLSVVRKDLVAVVPELIKAQDEVTRVRAVAQAATLGRKPTGPVAFRGVRLYDAKVRVFRPDMTVIVRGDRIEAVGRARSTKIPAGAEVIEGRGMTLLPGLFDMHVHLSRDSGGLIDIATGVTSVRDLANDPDDLAARKASFDSGELIGPRVFMAGIIDGKGPLAGPTKALVDTPEDARRVVADWADRGYPQVKLYSSIKPELMPVLIEEAKTRGLRISGHVPAGMTMEEVVLAGYDEVQHANFWILNFLGPEVAAKTNSPVRFIAVGEQGAALDLASPEVRAFVRLLRTRGTTLDPTMAAMEDALTGRRGAPSPSMAAVADRLPPVVRRGITGSGYAKGDEERARFVQAFARLGQFLKLLHDQGVPIVAGTDGGAASLTLVHELELYVASGLSPADALYTATLGAAKVAKADDRLGSIEPGKAADLLLVQGDPSRDMGDLRKGVLVLKGGVVFEPDALYRAVGIAPSTR